MSDSQSTSTRRDVMKIAAAAGVGAAVAPVLVDKLFGGIVTGSADAANVPDATWSKAPCRFCGTGCGTEVGVQDGRIVAVKGDPQAPVNRGLLCTKGYGLTQVLYGQDRLTTPQIRKDGKLVDATWEEALALIADTWTTLVETEGPDSVAVFGSGQWTIPEGYAALKWLKAGIRTNNLEPNARFCMASAVVGFLTTYGIDEPAGCYDDFDVADRFFLWGSNMAEMHPMLFNRILQRRQADPNVRIYSLQTYRHMTDDAADESFIFEPQTDLLIANSIAHVLMERGLVRTDFVEAHCRFVMSEHGEGGATYGAPTKDTPIDLAAYKTWLADYAPEKVAAQIGMQASDIERLAADYGNPELKCVSLWTMGTNQHTRGVWINNLLHNLHLLTGKISTPGNSPFSLTGQPSACGTCREVGTFTHRLPSDRVVMNPEHRAEMEKLWEVPAGTIPGPKESPLTHAMAMWEKVAAGKIKSVWVSTTNPFQTVPNLGKFVDRIRQKTEGLLIVSDVYPTATTELADVVLPSSMWVEKEGMFGNSERRTHHFDKLVDPPGEARSDVWQFVEVARRMGYEQLFPKAWDEHLERHIYDDYRKCTLGTKHDVATYDELKATRGMRWPVIDGKETRWRFNAKYDSYADPEAPHGIDFYGTKDHKAIIFARPYEAPAESPDAEYPFWLCTGRVLEHWHSGTMTRRVPQLHRAVPEALCYMNADDAAKLGISHGNMVRLTTRRGWLDLKAEVERRIKPPKGLVYVPFFDEGKLVNQLCLDAIDPMSKQPDYKKCGVRVERVS